MNEKGVKMQEKNVQGKKKQEKKVQGNKSQENRIQGKRVQEGKKQGSPKRENKRPESRAVKGVKPEQKQRSEQKQRTEQKQKAAKFGKPVLKQQSGQNVEKGKKNAKKSMCPVMRQCGGCQMLDMPYAEQLKTKRKRLETLLKGICPVKDMIGMEDPFYYRNKVHAVFDRDRRGNIISGIYQENTHNVVPVEKCMIEDQKADEIIGTIRGMLKSFKIRTFDEDTGYGLLRHVLLRRGFERGEIMVVLVTASPVFPSKNNFVKALREKHPEITTIVQNINGRGTSMVLGEKEHVLYGKGYIVDTLCGCSFRISSRSFYQVNPAQTEKLYTKALELAGLTGKETVVDAYCGIGTIGIIASKKAGNVIGVELNQDAVRDAINNAKMNQIDFAEFLENNIKNVAPVGEGYAGPYGTELLEMVLAFQETRKSEFKSVKRLSDGTCQFQFSDEKSGSGNTKMPEKISLAIAPFHNGAPYQVDARIRYRLRDGQLVLWYELIEPKKVVEHAFQEIVTDMENQLGEELPIYEGSL